jgi:hypothetical protein
MSGQIESAIRAAICSFGDRNSHSPHEITMSGRAVEVIFPEAPARVDRAPLRIEIADAIADLGFEPPFVRLLINHPSGTELL